MSLENTLELVVRFGLGMVLSIGAVYALWKITTFVLKENTKREDRLIQVIDTHLTSMHALLLLHDQRTIESSTRLGQDSVQRSQEAQKMTEALLEIVTTMRHQRTTHKEG